MKPDFAVGLELRRARNGKGTGLFLLEPVPRGGRILTFGGPHLDRTQYVAFADVDHCVQIGVDLFLGPSNELDDHVNHSCDPSTRVEIDRDAGRAHLVARASMRRGAEVTFDYSSVQLDDPRFRIERCRCGAASCRGVIGDFTLLDAEAKRRLFESGLCAWYIEEAFRKESAPDGPAPAKAADPVNQGEQSAQS